MPLIVYALTQCLLLCSGQVMLKLALARMGTPQFSWAFLSSQLTNWWFLGCGLCFGAGSFLWMYILKHFPFSMAYPLISLSYVFGMVAAMLVFHETIPPVRWFGVALIVLGCYLIAK